MPLQLYKDKRGQYCWRRHTVLILEVVVASISPAQGIVHAVHDLAKVRARAIFCTPVRLIVVMSRASRAVASRDMAEGEDEGQEQKKREECFHLEC